MAQCFNHTFRVSASVILLLFFISNLIMGQGIEQEEGLRIHIVHAQTRQPLTRALVKVGKHMQVFTMDEEGYCLIPMRVLPETGTISLEIYQTGIPTQYIQLPQSRLSHEVEVSLFPAAEPFTLEGKVINSHDEVMPFVTIVLWEDDLVRFGTVTNEQGEFSFSIPWGNEWVNDRIENLTLEARYLGGRYPTTLAGYAEDDILIEIPRVQREPQGCVFEDPIDPMVYSSTGMQISRLSPTDYWSVSIW